MCIHHSFQKLLEASRSLSANTQCSREIESSTLSFKIYADSFDSASLLRLDQFHPLTYLIILISPFFQIREIQYTDCFSFIVAVLGIIKASSWNRGSRHTQECLANEPMNVNSHHMNSHSHVFSHTCSPFERVYTGKPKYYSRQF